MHEVRSAGFAMVAMTASLALGFAVPVTAQTPANVAEPAAAATSDVPRAPDAIRALDQMSVFLRNLKQFRLEVDGFYETEIQSGEHIQLHTVSKFEARGTDHLAVTENSPLVNEVLLFDGKTLTSYLPDDNVVVDLPFTGTVNELLVVLHDRYGIDFPVQHMFRWGTESSWSGKPLKASYVGTDVIDGWMTDQYAVRMPDVDFQIWLDPGPYAVPRRVVVRETAGKGGQRYSANLKWDLAPSAMGDERFRVESRMAKGAPAPRRVSIDEAGELVKARQEKYLGNLD